MTWAPTPQFKTARVADLPENDTLDIGSRVTGTSVKIFRTGKVILTSLFWQQIGQIGQQILVGFETHGEADQAISDTKCPAIRRIVAGM